MLTKWALLFRLARRNVLRNRRRSIVILSAIAVGLWSMLTFASFTRGWSNDVIHSAIDTLTGHLQIHAPDYLRDPTIDHSMLPPSEEIVGLLKQPPVTAWAARVRVPAVVMSERETSPVTMVGINPFEEGGLSFIADTVTEGGQLEGPSDKGILIGRELGMRLGTDLGKRVVIMSQGIDHSIVDRGFKIVGIYDADRASTEKTFVFVGRSVAQEMLGLGDDISEIAAVVADPSQVNAFVGKLDAVSSAVDVRPWTDLEPMAEAVVALGQAWIWIFYFVMYIAIAFGLVNTLLMAVWERTREFGLVQALGMRPRFVLRQVLAESFLLLVLGTLLGVLFALITLGFLRGGIDFSAFAEGAEMWGMSKIIYPTLGTWDIASAVVFIVVLGVLASLYPAFRAARKTPIEAIMKG